MSFTLKFTINFSCNVISSNCTDRYVNNLVFSKTNVVEVIIEFLFND